MDPSTQRWFWTPARGGRCRYCRSDVAGQLVAYDYLTRSILCGDCAEVSGVASECRESKRAREARRARLIEEAESVPTLAGTA
ncbi:MAG: hypothetical protein ACRDMH_16385 [Solirubrobacterales bacterium]